MGSDRSPPEWLPPMLASRGAAGAVPSTWAAEPKWDGVRCLAVLDPGRGVTLWPPQHRDQTAAFAEIAEALASRARGFGILDGEIVAGAAGAYGDFGRLQTRLGRSGASAVEATGVEVSYHVFDVPWWDGADRRRDPWAARHALVERTVRWGGPLAPTPAWFGDRATHLEDVCAAGGEGLVLKRPGSPYSSRRSPDWVKLKCERSGEFVVGGWTDPAGSRSGFGALLLGAWTGGTLRYAGRVGTGFGEAELLATRAWLERHAVPVPPFSDPPRLRTAHWVAPVRLARVGFAEWTADGKLRHPRFIGWARTSGGAARAPRGMPRQRTAVPGRRVPGRPRTG